MDNDNILQINAVYKVFKIAKKYLGDNVLDYGCGEGLFARLLHCDSSISSVTGYDPCSESIKLASEGKVEDGLVFSDSKDVLIPGKYSGVLSTFVLHEAGSDILGEIYDVLEENGKVCIADYDLVGRGRGFFSRVFASDKELVELKKQGLDAAWRIHTARGLEDCVRDGEAKGFKTVDSRIVGNNYFLWVGKK